MQKAEPQHNQVQNQPTATQRKGAALVSPQGEQLAQLEAMAEASPQADRLAQLAAMANASPQAAAQRRTIGMIHDGPRMTAQRHSVDAIQSSSPDAAQRVEAEEPLQAKVAQREEAQAERNDTGLPDNLKSGIESLSGISMDTVRVHYNSSQPAQLNAHAYAQGTDIHVAPGQEQHLPHEAWHVVQQAQGRVRPTMQMKGDVPVNGDAGLEHEADEMGAKASSLGVVQGNSKEAAPIEAETTSSDIAQLSKRELKAASDVWAVHHGNHAEVNDIVEKDVQMLTEAYDYYANPDHGGMDEDAADEANPFLSCSAKGLKHDVEEIDSHAGGYYYQQKVKTARNATLRRDVTAQRGAHGGVSNTVDPDIIEQTGPSMAVTAVEAKRSANKNGFNSLMPGAIRQLSGRTGCARASVYMELTDPTEASTIQNDPTEVQKKITGYIKDSRKAFAKNYWDGAPLVNVATGKLLVVSVTIRSALPGVGITIIYERDHGLWLTRAKEVRRNTFKYDATEAPVVVRV